MHKKIFKKKNPSFFATLFHKPLLLIFIAAILPILIWEAQQAQLYISFGKNPPEIITQKLIPQQQSPCPVTSNQTYSNRRQNPNKPTRLNFDPSQNPETNIYLRGWYEVNEGHNLISRNGDNYGLDPNMPPQISTLFTTHYPNIIKTYRVNAWDYENNHNLPGQSATPHYAVHMLGLDATPAEPLVGLKAGNFLVRFATKNYILMTNGDEDLWTADEDGGYPFYFIDICVDPNLLAAYENANAGGRNELPMVSTGQIFGYAMTNEVKFIIRDTFSFMDTRYKEDWWEYGGFKPDFKEPVPTSLPITNPTTVIIPTNMPIIPSITPIIPTQIPPPLPTSKPITFPTQTQIQVTVIPIFITPTNLPTPTLTPTPKPLVDVKKTFDDAKSVWSRFFDSFIRFTKVILP